MSAADSTTAVAGQADDVTQKIAEAMKEEKKIEDHTSVLSGEGKVGHTTNPPKKIRDIPFNASDKERTVGHTAGPPLASLVDVDSDLFGGHTPEDTLGGVECQGEHLDSYSRAKGGYGAYHDLTPSVR